MLNLVAGVLFLVNSISASMPPWPYPDSLADVQSVRFNLSMPEGEYLVTIRFPEALTGWDRGMGEGRYSLIFRHEIDGEKAAQIRILYEKGGLATLQSHASSFSYQEYRVEGVIHELGGETKKIKGLNFSVQDAELGVEYYIYTLGEGKPTVMQKYYTSPFTSDDKATTTEPVPVTVNMRTKK